MDGSTPENSCCFLRASGGTDIAETQEIRLFVTIWINPPKNDIYLGLGWKSLNPDATVDLACLEPEKYSALEELCGVFPLFSVDFLCLICGLSVVLRPSRQTVGKDEELHSFSN